MLPSREHFGSQSSRMTHYADLDVTLRTGIRLRSDSSRVWDIGGMQVISKLQIDESLA